MSTAFLAVKKWLSGFPEKVRFSRMRHRKQGEDMVRRSLCELRGKGYAGKLDRKQKYLGIKKRYCQKLTRRWRGSMKKYEKLFVLIFNLNQNSSFLQETKIKKLDYDKDE